MVELATSKLINALLNPALYAHPVENIKLAETHISWVILTGPFAYKIKKPVNLGFLDFSTLALRQQYCEAELRLNRRLAPEFYLEVVAITGTATAPHWQGAGPSIEYAVKMRQFPTEMELDRLATAGKITSAHITQLAVDVATFHSSIPQADVSMTYGSSEAVWQPIAENFQQLEKCCQSPALREQLQKLWTWCVGSHAEFQPLLQARKREGYIRECHGDMHLANMFLWQDRVVVFDCLEFNASLRWIDVISEIAFLTMDLRDRNLANLASCFLDRYLQETGDYAGLMLLNCYQAYRAMVRAKVACIRLQQTRQESTEYAQQYNLMQEYLALAANFTRTNRPILFITHGVSGSGKTFFTGKLVATINAVRVRADVERKRLAGFGATANSASGLNRDLYSAQMGERTYNQLAKTAGEIIRAGFHAIVDATFLQHAQRAEFVRLAQELGVPMQILAFNATALTLQHRIQSRQAIGTDASEADLMVLQQQLARLEPLTMAERTYTIAIDTEMADAGETLLAAVNNLLSTATNE